MDVATRDYPLHPDADPAQVAELWNEEVFVG